MSKPPRVASACSFHPNEFTAVERSLWIRLARQAALTHRNRSASPDLHTELPRIGTLRKVLRSTG